MRQMKQPTEVDVEELFQQHYMDQEKTKDQVIAPKVYTTQRQQSEDWFSLLYVLVLIACFYKLNMIDIVDFKSFIKKLSLFVIVWIVWFTQIVLASWYQFKNDAAVHTACHFVQLCYLACFALVCTDYSNSQEAYTVFVVAYLISKSFVFIQILFVFHRKLSKIIVLYLSALVTIIVLWSLTLVPSLKAVENGVSTQYVWIWRMSNILDFLSVFVIAAMNIHTTLNIVYLCDRFSELVMATLSLIILNAQKEANIVSLVLVCILVYFVWYNSLYSCTYQDTNQIMWLISHFVFHASTFFLMTSISRESILIIPSLMLIIVCTSVTIRDKLQLLIRCVFTGLLLVYIQIPTLVVLDSTLAALAITEILVN